LLDAALHFKVITQSGSWFAFNDEKIAQGRDQVLQQLKKPETYEVIYTKVMECVQAEKEGGAAADFGIQMKEDSAQAEFE
jgi:recombination protein RecA